MCRGKSSAINSISATLPRWLRSASRRGGERSKHHPISRTPMRPKISKWRKRKKESPAIWWPFYSTHCATVVGGPTNQPTNQRKKEREKPPTGKWTLWQGIWRGTTAVLELSKNSLSLGRQFPPKEKKILFIRVNSISRLLFSLFLAMNADLEKKWLWGDNRKREKSFVVVKVVLRTYFYEKLPINLFGNPPPLLYWERGRGPVVLKNLRFR